MTDPARVDAELRVHFTPGQIVELSLDVTAWSKQKVLVGLGLDRPVDEHRLTQLTFDDAGRALY